LNACNQITEAWRARGNGYANGVSAEGWRGFHEHLIGVNADHFLLGLGSFNNNNETIVRYRNVQIHSLSSQSFHLLSN